VAPAEPHDRATDVPILGGLGVTLFEDAVRTEDLFFVANDPGEPALSAVANWYDCR
jgi:hypothetical protein